MSSKIENEQLSVNAVCFGILCNFTPICGEERAKEAADFVRTIYSKNKDLLDRAEKAERERDSAVSDISWRGNVATYAPWSIAMTEVKQKCVPPLSGKALSRNKRGKPES